MAKPLNVNVQHGPHRFRPWVRHVVPQSGVPVGNAVSETYDVRHGGGHVDVVDFGFVCGGHEIILPVPVSPDADVGLLSRGPWWPLTIWYALALVVFVASRFQYL